METSERNILKVEDEIICINNTGYENELTIDKIYKVENLPTMIVSFNDSTFISNITSITIQLLNDKKIYNKYNDKYFVTIEKYNILKRKDKIKKLV
jgi:hypothetical protein